LWEIAYLTPANMARVFSAKALVNWKPVLVFSNGPYKGDWYVDVVNNNAPDKRFHEWGQGVDGMAALVERFALPGRVVLDPFCGGSATGVAALKLGRRYIGSDSDPDAVGVSAKRLAELA
jgi:DNA modification methylase